MTFISAPPVRSVHPTWAQWNAGIQPCHDGDHGGAGSGARVDPVLATLGPAVFLAAGLWATSAASSTQALLSPVSSAISSGRGVTQTGIAVVFRLFRSITGRPGGFRRGRRVRGADQGHQALRETGQPGWGHPRPEDRSRHQRLRPDQRNADAVIVQDLDTGVTGGLRGAGRPRGLDRGQRALRDPGGPYPVHRRVVDDHQLDQRGLALPWWTGPDQATILQAVVNWGLGAHLIGGRIKVGVIAGSRASDQVALNRYLLPDLRTAGVDPIVKTIDADPNDTATTGAQSPLVIQQLRSAGVTSLIPLMPFNVFFPVLQAETAQQYFPRLLLSDYESSILSSLGLIPIPYAKALDGQEGVTTETLGGIDDDRPQNQGGYDAAVRRCWTVWHRVYPQVPPGNMNDFIEEQGPIAGWCQAIHLFETAAEAAGPGLNRRTFVAAMSRINNYPGTWSPVLSYGPNKRYGPTEYQVVRLHINSPPSSLCKQGAGHPPPATCWVTVQPWAPLPTG